MISLRGRWLSHVSFALIATAAWPAEYYVSPSGDDANSGKTPASAWRTIAKANAAVAPGDVVHLRGGKYRDDPIHPAESGTSSAPIRYVAYRAEVPVLTSDDVGGLDVAIELSGRSHIVVDGVHVDGVKPNPRSRVDHFATIADGSFNTIRNGRFENATGWHGFRLRNAHHNKLLDNVIDVVGVYDDGNGQDWGDSIQVDENSHYNLIEGNVITRGAHNLLQVKGTHNVIRDNVFDNDWSGILERGAGGRNLSLMGEHNLFENNVVRRARRSTDNPRNAGMKVEGRGNIVRRNVIMANSNEGITSQSRAGQKWAHHNHIYHNTFYANDGPAWGLVFYDGGKGVTGNVFKNNIVFMNRRASDVGDADIVFKLKGNPSGAIGQSVIESNLMARRSRNDAEFKIVSGRGVMSLTDAEKEFSSYVRNNIQDVPTFVVTSPESPDDFALAPGSRGIDEGAPLTRTRSAGSGRTIPLQDAGYFADGFSLVGGDRIRIDGGETLTIVGVDYSAASITVSESTSWSELAAVSLDYRGAAPDIGAREAGAATSGERRISRPTSSLTEATR